MAIGISIAIIGGVILLSSLKVIKEYERSVKFNLGKFSSVLKPGLNIVIPVLQTHQKADMRVRVADVPDQEAMTGDNISVRVNAVIYYKVTDAKKAILEVEHYPYAISQLAQTTMRNIVGEVELDDLLAKRDKVALKIKDIVDKETDPWGIKVNSVELKDIVLPEEMKRVIGKQAEAERERRAVITKAEGEAQAATNMSKAAKTLALAPGALHLRTLQSLNDISSDKSNTIIFAIPLEILKAFEGMTNKKK
ncbi:slipin family protein [archaeon]|jgi:regulator of protease activity HflC (stomatin/prohibitin superfamily)|nr:slipin family protein [archaeon]MBT3731192.1 slipin family protein [archaeon]MBT4670054.1 slipin family protein [archaeon]MBT5030655.1 slipin family protein [archaeon]MBT5288007.1 slipin family protein [archaeon]